MGFDIYGLNPTNLNNIDKPEPLDRSKKHTKKDIEIIHISKKLGISTFFLSFCSSAKDIKEMRSMFDYNVQIISKIESSTALKHLEEISKETDAILIDRGDLSREVPIENIPFLQKKIIDKTRQSNKSVYVATNLLESML